MPITQQDFHYVADLVRRRSAIVLPPGKEYLVESRLQRVAAERKVADITQLIQELRGDPRGDLPGRVVEAMTTNETSFFRDGRPFEALRRWILPHLIGANQKERRLRIWSAAASTGQEAYSLAILLREDFPETRSWQVEIVGTDLSHQALETARRGVYGQLEVNRGLPAAYLARWFERKGLKYEVHPELKKLVHFRPLNLAGTWPPMAPVDLVLIRNVLIYFDDATREDILRRAVQLLRPQGALLLGSAESVRQGSLPVTLERRDGAIWYRRAAGGEAR